MRITSIATACILAGVAFCHAGCFRLQRAKIRSTDQEHVLVTNYGWYLFHFIPVACGNASFNAWTPWVAFRNDVTLDKIQSRFMNYANGEECDVTDLSYTVSDSVMLNIPGVGLPLPVPYLLTYREVQLSGVLSKRKAPPRDESIPNIAPIDLEATVETEDVQ